MSAPDANWHRSSERIDRVAGRDFAGRCDWCTEDCFHDQPLVDGKDGDGVMHRDCAIEKDDNRIAEKYPTSDENRYLTESELDTRRERAAEQFYL